MAQDWNLGSLLLLFVGYNEEKVWKSAITIAEQLVNSFELFYILKF